LLQGGVRGGPEARGPRCAEEQRRDERRFPCLHKEYAGHAMRLIISPSHTAQRSHRYNRGVIMSTALEEFSFRARRHLLSSILDGR